jgi:(E)-4-hydroxy-3-methylbut-2-enyl-diphosphate synthase
MPLITLGPEQHGAPPRRRTPTVRIGGVAVGGAHPVVVQSMTNTDTADTAATVDQVARLASAGSEIVRVTVNNEAAAAAVPGIVQRLADQGCAVPIVGDFHYNGHLLLAQFPGTAAALAKYRINPGNVGARRRDENFRTIVRLAVEYGKPVRIGVNWGSLDQQLLTAMMDENARLPEPRCAPRCSPRRRASSTTASSSARRCPACRTWCASTPCSPPAATTRCTSD